MKHYLLCSFLIFASLGKSKADLEIPHSMSSWSGMSDVVVLCDELGMETETIQHNGTGKNQHWAEHKNHIKCRPIRVFKGDLDISQEFIAIYTDHFSRHLAGQGSWLESNKAGEVKLHPAKDLPLSRALLFLKRSPDAHVFSVATAKVIIGEIAYQFSQAEGDMAADCLAPQQPENIELRPLEYYGEALLIRDLLIAMQKQAPSERRHGWLSPRTDSIAGLACKIVVPPFSKASWQCVPASLLLTNCSNQVFDIWTMCEGGGFLSDTHRTVQCFPIYESKLLTIDQISKSVRSLAPGESAALPLNVYAEGQKFMDIQATYEVPAEETLDIAKRFGHHLWHGSIYSKDAHVQMPDSEPPISGKVIIPATTRNAEGKLPARLVLTNHSKDAARICTHYLPTFAVCDGVVEVTCSPKLDWSSSENAALQELERHITTLAPGESVDLPFDLPSLVGRIRLRNVGACYSVSEALATRLNLWHGDVEAQRLELDPDQVKAIVTTQASP